uniref:50S ribosomal protein L13 n=1 Tax=Lygus hesperus TaxID=30085 RepID=A0A0A9Y275_LYGHE
MPPCTYLHPHNGILCRYVGHLKSVPASELRERYPERILLHSIRGMVPKTVHRLQQLHRLHVLPTHEHPFTNIFPEIKVEGEEDATKKFILARNADGVLIDTWDPEGKLGTIEDLSKCVQLPKGLQNISVEH